MPSWTVSCLNTERETRRRLRASLADWAALALAPQSLRPAAHHSLLLRELEAVAEGGCDRLMVLMPPGSAKSTYASLVFPPWWFARHPASSVIAASHTASLARGFGRGVRALVAEHAARLGYALDPASRAAHRFGTTRGGSYFATGVRGPVTGRRADLVLIDDPVKSQAEADSPAARDHLWSWYRSDLTTRLRPGGRIVLVMTRWHPDDLGGRLLEGPDPWRVLRLPALAEGADPLGRAPGEPLWPEWEGAEILRRKRLVLGERAFDALFQQSPRASGGRLFAVARIGFVDLAAAGQGVRAWDLAASAVGNPDWTVGLKLVRTEAGAFQVADVVRLQGGPHEVEQTILATAKRDGPGVPVGLPQDPGQAGRAQVLYLTRMLAGFRVVATPETGAKETRAMPVASQCNAGNLALVRAPPTAANTVLGLAATDFVAVSQGGQPKWVSYANLIPGQGVDQLPSAFALSDTDACLVGQGGALARGTLQGLSEWIWNKQAATALRRVEEAASTALTFARHHRAVVTCPNAITLTVANFADVGDGFQCEVVNTGAGVVTFGAGIICTGGATVPPRQTVVVRGLSTGGGAALVLANTPALPQTLIVNPIGTQVAGQAFVVSGTYANGTPSGFEWSTDGTSWLLGAGAAVGGGTYTFSLTLPNTGTVTLRVRDRVTLVSGNSGSFAVSAAPPAPPGQVTGLAAGTPGTSYVSLSWTAPAGGGAPGAYTVEYRTGGGAWATATSTAFGSPYTVTGLAANTAYEFRVTATNSGGGGPASASATANTAPPPPVLDTVATAAAAAYGVRRLRAVHAGAALRVRRSSDNAEQDIGFTSAGLLDTAALLAFVGKGSGFVSRFYDQSGSSRDAVQAAAEKQPKIVDAGALQLFPGTARRPGLVFDNVVEQLLAAPGVAVGGTDLTLIAAVTTGGGNGAANRVIGYKTTGKSGDTPDSLRVVVDTYGERIRAARGGVSNPGVALVGANTPHVVSLASVGTAMTLYDNSGYTAYGTVAIDGGTYGATGTVVIGGEGAGNSYETLSGCIPEAYVFAALSAADRQAIEASMRQHYGV